MTDYAIRMTVQFVPIPRERYAAWRAAITTLAEWLIEDEMIRLTTQLDTYVSTETNPVSEEQ